MINIVNYETLECLTKRATVSERARQHLNLHESYDDGAQVLLNVILKDSYIRPHSHYDETGSEYLFVLNGSCVVVVFDEMGVVVSAFLLQAPGLLSSNGVFGVKILPKTWHTVYSLTDCCTLLECKAGPFNPLRSKLSPDWAPEEGAEQSDLYLGNLKENCEKIFNL